ncbi:hypothetical protein [Humibacter sp.]|uniref:hypothetical protein n=1 Tax=Humibacter sp. TaxID=1940291 RepID=UPI003F804695
MSEYRCNTEGCSIGDCDNCLAVAELRAALEVETRDAKRYRALHPYLRGCMGYDERGHVLILGPRSIPTGVQDSGWTGELIDAAADYAVAVKEGDAAFVAAALETSAQTASTPVHNHGPSEGPGLACRERMIGGRLVGDCLAAVRSPRTEAVQ